VGVNTRIGKVGDLVIPTSFSKYKIVYPAKMIVELSIAGEDKLGEKVVEYRLENEDLFFLNDIPHSNTKFIITCYRKFNNHLCWIYNFIFGKTGWNHQIPNFSDSRIYSHTLIIIALWPKSRVLRKLFRYIIKKTTYVVNTNQKLFFAFLRQCRFQ
jgi:hypothetical protein